MNQFRDTARLNEQYASDEPLRVRQDTHARYGVGIELEAVIDDALGLSGLEALLDVGTGPGDFPARLRRQGHTGRLVGLDRSDGMVKQARITHASLEPLEFLEGDAMALPFEAASFQVVTARHMLYHVPDVRRALEEAARVLKPGGRFLALTNADGYMHEFWQLALEAVTGLQPFQGVVRTHGQPLYFHEDLAADIRAVFGHAELRVLEGALIFPEPEPALRYFDSTRSQYGLEPETWALGAAAFRSRLERLAYPWRVTRNLALILATRD